MTQKRIFVSLTQRDTPIAEALEEAIKTIFGDLFKVKFSTSKKLDGGIHSGADWFQWIVDLVKECEIAFVLVTPNSVQKPWIMWESGAVYGAAMATGDTELNKVRPLVFQLRPDEIPSPIKDAKIQYRSGENREDVSSLMWEIVNSLTPTGELHGDALRRATTGIEEAVAHYLTKVEKALLNAPALPSGNVVEEWRHRLDQIANSNRPSEAEQLNRWMDITFGLEEGEPQAIDLRIHARLGEIYLQARKAKKAISQFRLARRLAPRDIYVLRMLGKAYLDDDDPDEAEKIITRIKELDPEAVKKNAECAALEGRWYRERKLWEQAGNTYEAALPFNPDSYYLANLAAEAFLAAGDEEKAKSSFQRARDIIQRIDEKNVWTLASLANATLALEDNDTLMEWALDEIRALDPTAGEKESIRRGLRHIADTLSSKPDISELLVKLD